MSLCAHLWPAVRRLVAISLAVASVALAVAPAFSADSSAADTAALAQFHASVSPILQAHCYDCHGGGVKKAGFAFDELTSREQLLGQPEFWLKVLRNTRSHVMPPPGESTPTAAQQSTLEKWIIAGAFGLNLQQPDPGRVTVRRLNRTEYRNTLRDLIGVDFDVDHALPPDDVGYGFDNIGDVLNLSPMRTEKFLEAAMNAVNQGVPQDTVVIPTRLTLPQDFRTEDGGQTAEHLSFYQMRKVSHRYTAKATGDYRVLIASKVDGEANRDPQQVRIAALSDGREFFRQDYQWSDAEYFNDERVIHWEAGEHELSFTTQPLFPELTPLRTKMEYKILYVKIEGPLDRKDWLQPPGYRQIYSRDVPPEKPAERRAYARETLARFVTKAYRRPVAPETIEQLVDLAEKSYSVPGTAFEKGVAQAIIAVLASPRFLFHLEAGAPLAPGQSFALLDEYSLAARLSYALWSSLPDDELTQLAARGELRKNFAAQVRRLIADPKARAFSENFSGQWLQSRGVLDVPINSAVVMADEPPLAPPPTPAVAVAGTTPGRGFGGRVRRGPAIPNGTELTTELRAAMKQETEAYFAHIVTGDRSVLELLDSDYIFVNDQLAPLYGITGITGPALRRITLPPDNPRGGVLTMGSTLTVTSNPTRTSPVKRGKWILENILGTPPAPPPPDIPALEDAKKKSEEGSLSQRELLALHRADPMCASCHSRMDPLGLALETFNAFGRSRTLDAGKPIEPAGELATGEKFSGIRDLKRALVENHRTEFYRTITEKLLTYTLGRGVEFYDVPTVDQIVARLDRENGRFSALLLGVLESAPFQQRRPTPHAVSQPPVNASPSQ